MGITDRVTADDWSDQRDPDWWALIDRKAAMREQFPSADVVRATERVSLGLLHRPLTPAERVTRAAETHERNADAFIARMEARTGIGAAHNARLAELANVRAVARRDAWKARMRERGLLVEDTA